MLDQLLLRYDDQRLVAQSALSLQYLVLDEFHAYDGAQGTDVAMLLRRLGLALKSYWPDDAFTDADRARPLGRITPVATSATLGDKGDPAAMIEFARLPSSATSSTTTSVVTESRLSLDEWAAGCRRPYDRPWALPPAHWRGQTYLRPTPPSRILGTRVEARARALAVLGCLYDTDAATLARPSVMTAEALLSLVQAHPLVHELVAASEQAVHLGDLAGAAVSRARGRSD